MIRYNGTLDLLFRMRGSVLPFAARVAVPCAAVALVLKYLQVHDMFTLAYFKIDDVAYRGFTALLGFLIIFRTKQSYERFWVGGGLLQQMCGSWLEAASSVVAFCKVSKAEEAVILHFQHILVRLFSLLVASALTELQGTDESDAQDLHGRLSSLDIIDGQSLDWKTRQAFLSSSNKVELVFQWIQSVMVSGCEQKVFTIPPPILARAFNELADGMVKFNDCMKIAVMPFPFPYAQATLILLSLHSLITPVMICTWTGTVLFAAVFSFLILFIFWGLYGIGLELENPFGEDPNDLDAIEIQQKMNKRLAMVFINPNSRMMPSLVPHIQNAELREQALARRMKLIHVWGNCKPESAQSSVCRISTGS
mmetsp:Transcript_8940/g.24819  ORF Transcript_8940/g.24819 Transcript_8940/m.24819 type:complete len:366 (-) Transcript_8940:80-1177(-)